MLPLDISWPHLAVGVCGSWPVIWTWRGWVVIHQAWKKSIPGEFLRKHMWKKTRVEYLKAAGDIMWYDSYAGISIRNPIPSFKLLLHIRCLCKRKQPCLVGWSHSLNIWGIMTLVCWSCFLVAWGMIFFFGWLDFSLVITGCKALDRIASWQRCFSTEICTARRVCFRNEVNEAKLDRIRWNWAGMLRRLVQEFLDFSQSFT